MVFLLTAVAVQDIQQLRRRKVLRHNIQIQEIALYGYSHRHLHSLRDLKVREPIGTLNLPQRKQRIQTLRQHLIHALFVFAAVKLLLLPLHLREPLPRQEQDLPLPVLFP